MRAYLHVLKYVGGATPRLVRHSTVPIGDPYASHDLHGFGACGIAVKDLNETGVQGTTTPEVLVTTLNGEFVVFAQTGGVLNPLPLFRDVLDGQLGAFNSIVVDDLDQDFFGTKPEVYIATSTGVRKFYVQ